MEEEQVAVVAVEEEKEEEERGGRVSRRGQLSEKSYKYQGRSRAYGSGEGLGAELSFQRPPRLEMGTSDITKCTARAYFLPRITF